MVRVCVCVSEGSLEFVHAMLFAQRWLTLVPPPMDGRALFPSSLASQPLSHKQPNPSSQYSL